MPYEQAKIGTRPDANPAADAVLALAFGICGDGAANRVLAKIAAQYSRENRIPLICQTEIARYLPNNTEFGVSVIPSSSHRQDTWEAVEIAREEFCEPNHWKNLILVAHPSHQSRAQATAEAYKFSVRADSLGPVPFDPKSDEWWTRGPISFGIANTFAWFLYLYYRYLLGRGSRALRESSLEHQGP